MQDRLIVTDIYGKPITLEEFNNVDRSPEVDISVGKEQLRLQLIQRAERV